MNFHSIRVLFLRLGSDIPGQSYFIKSLCISNLFISSVVSKRPSSGRNCRQPPPLALAVAGEKRDELLNWKSLCVFFCRDEKKTFALQYKANCNFWPYYSDDLDLVLMPIARLLYQHNHRKKWSLQWKTVVIYVLAIPCPLILHNLQRNHVR